MDEVTSAVNIDREAIIEEAPTARDETILVTFEASTAGRVT